MEKKQFKGNEVQRMLIDKFIEQKTTAYVAVVNGNYMEHHEGTILAQDDTVIILKTKKGREIMIFKSWTSTVEKL